MADQPATTPPPADSKDSMRHGLLTTWHFVSYLVPMLLFSIAYFFVPAMNASIHEPISDGLWKHLFFFGMAGAIWIILDMVSVYNHRTSAMRLRENTVISFIVAMFFAAICGYLDRGGQLGWYLLVPAVASFVDAIATALMSIENALGKPNIQVESEIGRRA